MGNVTRTITNREWNSPKVSDSLRQRIERGLSLVGLPIERVYAVHVDEENGRVVAESWKTHPETGKLLIDPDVDQPLRACDVQFDLPEALT